MSKILIVEDEDAIRRVLKKILSEEDKSQEVVEAENGIEALNVIKKTRNKKYSFIGLANSNSYR